MFLTRYPVTYSNTWTSMISVEQYKALKEEVSFSGWIGTKTKSCYKWDFIMMFIGTRAHYEGTSLNVEEKNIHALIWIKIVGHWKNKSFVFPPYLSICFFSVIYHLKNLLYFILKPCQESYGLIKAKPV